MAFSGSYPSDFSFRRPTPTAEEKLTRVRNRLESAIRRSKESRELAHEEIAALEQLLADARERLEKREQAEADEIRIYETILGLLD